MLSLFSEIRSRQSRVTLSQKSLPEVCAPNNNPSTSGQTPLGHITLQSALGGESNGICFEASTWLLRSTGRKRLLQQQADVGWGGEGSHWNPLAVMDGIVYSPQSPDMPCRNPLAMAD